jgi:hypothetical protein
MLHGMTFTVPAPAEDPTGDAIIAAYPHVADRKIPMNCQFRPEINSWECDVPKWYERKAVLFGIGGGIAAFVAGVLIGRRG